MKHPKLRQGKVIRELYELDHCFLSKEGVMRFTEPFGFQGSVYLTKANPQDFKGLTLRDKDGNLVDEMEGQDASVVATEIAAHLGIKVKSMFGRGSQLRMACTQILEHLNSKELKEKVAAQ